MFSLGFGFVEIGTVTPRPQKGNIKPRVFRLIEDKAIINITLVLIILVLQKTKKNLNNFRKFGTFDKIIGVNIGKNKDTLNAIDDYLYLIEELGDLSSYITINISSPNTEGLRDLQLRGNIENLIKKILQKRDQIESINFKPVLIKISPDLNDNQLRDIALISLANNVDGLILTNTTITRNQLLSKFKFKTGGLSGKPLYDKSNTIIKKMYNFTNGQIPIIGVGGISNGIDCYNKMKAELLLSVIYSIDLFRTEFNFKNK